MPIIIAIEGGMNVLDGGLSGVPGCGCKFVDGYEELATLAIGAIAGSTKGSTRPSLRQLALA